MNSNLYEHDFNAWIHSQISLLTQGKVSELDIEHLVEELEDMRKSNLNELENRYVILIAHLLKWQFQCEQQSSRWLGTINEQRVLLSRLIRKNPSLKTKVNEAIQDVYPDALDLAIRYTNLDETTFPAVCPYTHEQLLDNKFFPSNSYQTIH